MRILTERYGISLVVSSSHVLCHMFCTLCQQTRNERRLKMNFCECKCVYGGHNERICRSFCMFTLPLIKFLMHVSGDLHRNAEPDLLMFRYSMRLVLQNA